MVAPGRHGATNRLAVLLTSIAALAVAGCARRSPPAPMRPPLRAEIGYALGSPVDPPVPGGAAGGVPLVLRLEGYATGTSASLPGESLAAGGGLVISSANEPLATAPPAVEAVRLVKDTSVLPAPAGRGGASLFRTTVPLPEGCTTTVSFFEAAGGPRPGSHPVLRVGIVSPAAAGRDRPRLVVSAAAAESEDRTSETATRETGDPSLLMLDWPAAGPTGEFALYFPADRRRGIRVPTVWRFVVSDGSDDAGATRAAAQILADLSAAPRSTPPARGALLATALAPSAAPPDLRGALLAVSAEVRGEVSSEAALLLDDEGLTAAAAHIAEALAAAPPDSDTSYLGWVVDQALLAGLAKLASGGEFPPEVGAMLSARFGEAGRDPGSLGELAASSPSRADFDTRVRAENLILLDDASVSSRVRAFEWMASRNDAPNGYNPFAAPAERRAAIDAHLQSLTRQPETNPATHPSTEPAR